MTTKTVGGTVRDITGTPIENAEIRIHLLTQVAFRTVDDSSVVTDLTLFTAADGTWSATIECNDTITPAGTLYEVKEDYAFGGWKTYLIQVLSSLPVGTNQVLDLIIPEMSPVGIVNAFLTQALADTLYEPLGGGGGGGSSVTEYNEDDVAPANPTGPTVVAIRADSLSAQGSNGDWVALRATANGELYVKVVDSINVLGPLTDAQLRATPIPISGALTDAQLRATPVPVTGGGGGTEYTEGATDATITGQAMLWEDTADTLRAISAAKPLPVGIIGTVPTSGPLTDAQLRAVAVPVSLASIPSHSIDELPTAAALADNTANPTTTSIGALQLVFDGATWDRATQALTDTQLRATAVPVSGPLTDIQLRATPVPVTGGGGGTEYTEDAVTPADPVGTTVMMRRDDSRTAAVSANGDWIASHGTSSGSLWVAGDPDFPFNVAGQLEGYENTDLPQAAGLVGISARASAAAPADVSADGDQIQIWTTRKGAVNIADAGGSITVDGTVAVSGAIDTELPTAAALADNMANPTAPAVAGHNMVWDGATWDRQVPPLTDTQLRASAVPVSLASVPSHAIDELPAAAALADATANPTTTSVGVENLLFNGTTWDRVRGSIANGMLVDISRQPSSTSATVTQVAVSTTSAQLQASNAARKGLAIFNDAATVLFVKFGTTASGTSLTVKIPAAAVYEIPGAAGMYTGRVDGILASGTGNAYVTEW